MDVKQENNPEHLQIETGNTHQGTNQVITEDPIKDHPVQIKQNAKSIQTPLNHDINEENVEVRAEQGKNQNQKEEKIGIESKIQEVGDGEDKGQIAADEQTQVIGKQQDTVQKQQIKDKEQAVEKTPDPEPQNEQIKTTEGGNKLAIEEDNIKNDVEFGKFEENSKIVEKQQQVLQTNHRIKDDEGGEKYQSFKISISYLKPEENKEDKKEEINETEAKEELKEENNVVDKQIPNQQPIQEPIPAKEQVAEEQKLSNNQPQVSPQQDINKQQKAEPQQKISQIENQPQQAPAQEQRVQEQKRQPSESKQDNPNPIRMTEQNEEPVQQTINAEELNGSSKQIVQFEEYKPAQEQSKQSVNPNTKEQQQEAYKDIKNQVLLKRIQELQETVKELKSNKQTASIINIEQGGNKTVTKTIQKSSPQKKKSKEQQVIHDQNVHGLVSELAKTESMNNGIPVKKPVLQQKRYKKRKIDLSALMDKNMIHASNIFNLTIGEIINPNAKHEEEKQLLKKQIKQLREKVLKLEQDKRASSAQKPIIDTRRETASTGKKQMCGKLIKVSELRASRVTGFDDNDSVFKVNLNQKIETRSQRESFGDGIALKNKISSNSATQREERQAQRQKDAQNNLSFRVRRPTAKSNNISNMQAQTSSLSMFNSQDRIDPFPVLVQEKKQKQQTSQILKKQWWQEPFIKPLQMPEIPSPPSQFDSQQDLYTLGKLTFIAFGINFDSSKQMSVKKYKNCVYFNLGEKNNILWYFDGRFYIGEWQVHLTGEGEKSGQGFEYVPGKFIYEGEFKQGKRNKYGTIKILNKEKLVMYEGNWVDGNKCGEGKQIDQYGIKYWGEWKQNKRQGFGRLKLEDGDYYEGNFQKGIKTGFGKQTFKNGDRYEGNYLSNKFHGKGKYIWKNGSVYEGEFNHGIRSGQGKWKSSETAAEIDQYQGQYENDKKNGYGKYRWADGSEYQGFFKEDLKEGEGTIRYKNGKVAKLLWKNGQPIKKIFSDEQKNYRQTQKSRQKIPQSQNSKRKVINRNETLSSHKKTITKDD